MVILVTGSNGLLGQKLVSLIQNERNFSVHGCSRGGNRNPEFQSNYHSIDLIDLPSTKSLLEQVKPDVVINTAAMTNVDQCELEQKECWEINVEAVNNLVNVCNELNTFLLQVSTDFIFDGTSENLNEEAIPNPVNFYGESKLAAEKLVMEKADQWAIARTILVHGVTPDMSRSNIVLWVKDSLKQEKHIYVVNDQWRSPTLAEDLAMGCFLIAKHKAEGIYHLSGKDYLTPYKIALITAKVFELDQSFIHETDSERFTQPARRPLKTGFNISKAKKELGYSPNSFEEGLMLMKEQLEKI